MTMADRRQQPISISSRERAILNRQKLRYESSTGRNSSWGGFLGTVALLGLAAVGVYRLVRGSERSPQSMDVECTNCEATFIMAIPEGADRAVYTLCPHCGDELVVDLGISR